MTLKSRVPAAALLLATVAPAALAEPAVAEAVADTTTIDIAGHPVPVPAGGLYARYRSNTPLSVVAAEQPALDLRWFRTLKREKVDIGFESWSPNFYYRNSLVTAVFTADLERLRALMPPEVLAQVQPLQIWPGRGLVAMTAYAYHYCDNDRYNEFALSVVTHAPGKAKLGPISLVAQLLSADLWGHVLKLPVDTELARVRGVVGYNLPKWRTPMRFDQTTDGIRFEIADADSGARDLVLAVRAPDSLSDRPTRVKSSFVNLDGAGRLSSGYAVSRKLRHAAGFDPEAVTLELGQGSLSTFVRSLDLGRMLHYQYVPDFQSALYAPKPLVVKP